MSDQTPESVIIGTDEDTGVTIWGYWDFETLHITRVTDVTGEDLTFAARTDGHFTVTMPFAGSQDWGIGPYAHEDARPDPELGQGEP